MTKLTNFYIEAAIILRRGPVFENGGDIYVDADVPAALRDALSV